MKNSKNGRGRGNAGDRAGDNTDCGEESISTQLEMAAGLCWRVVFGVSIAMFSMTTLAAQWTLQSSVGVGVGRNDNPRLATGETESVTNAQVTPRLGLTGATERSSLDLDIAILAKRYSGTDAEDTHRDTVVLSSFFDTTERSKVALDANLRRDYLFESVTDEAGTGDLDDTDVGLSRAKVRRDVRTMVPSLTYALSELSNVTLRYRQTDVDFTGPVGTELRNYAHHDLSASYTRRLNVQNTLNVVVGTFAYRPESAGRESDTDRILVGWTRAFSETARGRIQVGPTRTTERTTAGELEASGFAVELGGTEISELTTLSAVASRAVRASGGGQSVESDQIRLNLRRNLSALSDLGVRVRAFRNEVLEGTNPGLNRTYIEVAPEYRWQVAQGWRVTTSYAYRRQKSDAETESADSNAVFVGLEYGAEREM